MTQETGEKTDTDRAFQRPIPILKGTGKADKMRIAIVDDERAMREQLEGYARRWAEEKRTPLETVLFDSGDALLKAWDGKFDIVIFDIDMPGTNGLDAARQIRETDGDVVILFITNIAQYAINGYEVDAVDYVIKPIGYYDFALKLHKAVRRAERNRGSVLYIDTVNGPAALETDSILYVEVMGHYLVYHGAGGEYRVRASMKEHEDFLRGYHFARCHKSYLVNLKHLKGMTASEVLAGDLSIPLGRAYKDTMLAEYMNYLHRG